MPFSGRTSTPMQNQKVRDIARKLSGVAWERIGRDQYRSFAGEAAAGGRSMAVLAKREGQAYYTLKVGPEFGDYYHEGTGEEVAKLFDEVSTRIAQANRLSLDELVARWG